MKKLSKICFVLLLLLTVLLSTVAAATMNVSWQWILNDLDVTAYRYQLNGEEDGNWIVVDGTTSSFTATGLDPYLDYTLYLQASYDGINWSESASSLAPAMLKAESEKEVSEVVEEVEVQEVVEPVFEETTFYVYGYGVENKWTDGYFESRTLDKGLVSASDVQSFALYELEKYPYLENAVAFSLVPDGFALSYDGVLNISDYISLYRDELTQYVTSLFTPVEVAETVEVEKVEEIVEVESVPYFSTIFAYKGITSNITAYKDNAVITIPEGVTLSDISAIASMLLAAYPEASFVEYRVDGDNLLLTYPEQSEEFIQAAVALLEKEAKALIDSLTKEEVATPPVVVEEVAPVVEVEPVVEEVVVEPVVVEEVKAEPVVAEPTPEPAPVVEVEPIAPVTPVAKEAPKAKSVSAFTFKTGANAGLAFKHALPWDTVDTVYLYPEFSLYTEAQNIIHFGLLGFGLRSDVTAILLPLTTTPYIADFFENSDYYLNRENWGVDATLDLKLMAYLNTKIAKLYVGAGMGYSLVSNGFDPVDSTEAPLYGFNTTWALTGLAGASFNLGNHVTLNFEGNAKLRVKDINTFALDKSHLFVGANVGLGIKF